MKNLKNIQQALINIFKVSIQEGPLEELARTCHLELKKLIGREKTKNFYLALYVGNYNYVLPYHRDEIDESDPGNEPFSLQGGITDYIRRTGKTELIDIGRFRELIKAGKIEKQIGELSHHWVGVPLAYGGEVHGVLVIQSYDQAVNYTREDVELIDYVSGNIALAIERKDKDRQMTEYKENLEKRIKEDSKELIRRNAKLKREIAKEKKSEKIQRVLYNISEAKSNTRNLNELLAGIHEQVGTLMEASNFYVAILEDRERAVYSFPYMIDENPGEMEDPENLVVLSGGFTHYVLETEKPMLADNKKVKELAESGAVVFVGKVPQSWLGIPLKTEGGEVLGVVVVQSYSDPRAYTAADKKVLAIISSTIAGAVEYKQLEEKQAALEERLLESQKMEAVGILAAGVAHEFNNLLSIIIGHAYNGMRISKENDEKHYKRYSKIEKTGEQAAELVEKLMIFSKKRERGRALVNDIGQAIHETVYRAKTSAPKGCSITLDVKSELWQLKIDREELDDLLSNILDNAFHAVAGKERGLVNISADNFMGRPNHAGLTEASKYIYFKIEDNGCGMDDKTRSQIFNPFFTTRDPGDGTGMGLAIVYTIVEEYYGTIEVDSEPGTGTVFHIYLPVTFFS
ncbi:MAG: GAF domain-containing protein [bacterium]|nr:GAF domain-containing protein [bacterium]